MKQVLIKVIEKPDRIFMEEKKQMIVSVNGKKIIVVKNWKDDKGSIRSSHSFKVISIKMDREEKEALDNYMEDFEW